MSYNSLQQQQSSEREGTGGPSGSRVLGGSQNQGNDCTEALRPLVELASLGIEGQPSQNNQLQRGQHRLRQSHEAPQSNQIQSPSAAAGSNVVGFPDPNEFYNNNSEDEDANKPLINNTAKVSMRDSKGTTFQKV